jgi:signal transduction histidine kinase
VAPARAGGGRGLRGIRERVTILGGRMSAGADDGRWRVSVALPVVPWTGATASDPAADRPDGGNDGIERAGV